VELVLGVVSLVALAAAGLSWRRQRTLQARLDAAEARTATVLDDAGAAGAGPGDALRLRRWLEHLAWVAAVDARVPSQRALDDLLALRHSRVEHMEVGERHLLDGAVASTQAALRLHDDLRAWATSATVAAVPTTLEAREALDVAVSRLDDDGKVTLDVGPLPQVTADPELLATALHALLDNCVRHRWPGRPVQVEVSGEQVGDRVLLRITDDGVGVDPDAQAHLWLPFTRGDGQRAAPGVGLGLPTVARAVEACGGTTRFVSHEGRGSTVELDLPAVPA